MKRLIAGITLLILTAGGVYGYTVSRRERTYVGLVSQGDGAMAADNPAGAIEAFSVAVAIKPDAMLGYLKRGEAYRRRGDLEAALRDLQRATDLDATATRPLEELGDVETALRRFASAANRYRAYTHIDDRVPRVLYKLGYAEYSSGRPAAALEPLQKAIALDERMAEAYYVLGLAQRALDRRDAARGALEKAIALQPALLRAREELADLYGATGKAEKRLDQLEALAALDPSPSRAVALGLAYARGGQADRAVVTLASATKRYPEQPGPYVALGRVWLEIAQERSDRVALSKAMGALEATLDRSDSESLTLFGRALLLARDVTSAERTLQDAASRRPADPAAFYYLAEAAQQLRHFGAARQALIDYRALHEERDPRRNAAQQARLGELSLRLNDPAAAARFYLDAADSARGEASYLARAAAAQWRLGDREAARATLARALERDPTNAEVLAVKRRLSVAG